MKIPYRSGVIFDHRKRTFRVVSETSNTSFYSERAMHPFLITFVALEVFVGLTSFRGIFIPS